MSLVRFSHTHQPYVNLANKIRHIYDVHLILKNEEVVTFFNSVDFDKLLIQVGKDDVVIFKNNNEWLQNHPELAIVFSHREDIWDKIKTSYRTTFKELVLGEMPAEVDLVNTSKHIHSRLEKVKWDFK